MLTPQPLPRDLLLVFEVPFVLQYSFGQFQLLFLVKALFILSRHLIIKQFLKFHLVECAHDQVLALPVVNALRRPLDLVDDVEQREYLHESIVNQVWPEVDFLAAGNR